VRSWQRRAAVWVAVADLIAVVFFGVISPGHVFFHGSNFSDIALDASEIVLMSGGLALVLAAGEIDISIGSNLVLSSVVGAKVMVALAGTSQQVASGSYPHLATGLLAGIVSAIAVSLTFGLVNGLLVTWARINSFIVTLATMGAGLGLAEVLTGGLDVSYVPPQLGSSFGLYEIGGVVPAPALLTLAVVGVLWYVLAKTRFGLRTVALGSSREAVTRVGIKTGRHVVLIFVIAGLTAGLAALIDVSRLSGTDITGHQTDALSAVAAVVIGGANLFGGDVGEVSIPGAVFGALLTVILQVGLVIEGLSTFYQPIIIGAVLLVAVFIRRQRTEARTSRNSTEKDIRHAYRDIRHQAEQGAGPDDRHRGRRVLRRPARMR
jgi:ribose transport system permease protein